MSAPVCRKNGRGPVAPPTATTISSLRGESGMTIDAVRAGYRLREYELDLAHRATGRTIGGFIHRFRQLVDFARVYLSRR